VEILSAPPHVSININLDGENENSIIDAKLQQANIARMVKEKDLDSIQKFGGIKGISEALDTDLETGIRCSRHRASTLSTAQTPERGFFKFLLKYCSNCIIFLLFVSAVLSLGFGIGEEGLRTGWYEGVIIIIAIVILVAAPSLRDFWLEHSWKMSGKQKPLEVDVLIGGHPQKVHMGDVLVGDIVCLEKETLIPADGLFIPGDQLLKLNDGLESTIDDRNPFLFYGAKVVDGSGRMLVTSVGMDTTWSQLIGGVIHPRHKTSLPAELDRVSTRTQITGLSISILILVVLFLRFKFKKEDVGSNLPELKGGPIRSKEIIDATMRFVMKLNGKTRTLITSLTILLVGVTEGIPFVVALTIDYWNKKMLSDKAFAQEPLACLTMASVTTICIDKTGWPTLDPSADDVCRTETRNAIEGWKKNGVSIILISEDDVSVLEDIARGFGLLANSTRSSALEGEQFQNYSNEERMNEVDKIMVMGSSSPSHRLLLVQCLKKKGHKVAMVGVKTNEIPALKEADVGIVMENCSSEMARENSDIIIRDGNISFLVTIVSCGRCTYDNIRKYIQLVLTMNIAGWLITLITTICFGYSPITAIQLLWANFFVTLLGGFALLTEPTTEKLMEKPPMRQSEPLITKAMWRNLVSQALYQVAILVTFQFKGEAILGISKDVSKTIIFNTFFLCQVFNQVNARELERKNVFRDIHSNPWFLVAMVVIVGLQVAFIEIAHFFVSNARLNWVQWFVCLVIGMVSWAIDWATKYTSGCIMDCFDGSHMGTTGTTPSDPSVSATLELPLMNGNLTPVSS
jgi:magnesium-transporting ATPase (P-type)